MTHPKATQGPTRLDQYTLTPLTPGSPTITEYLPGEDEGQTMRKNSEALDYRDSQPASPDTKINEDDYYSDTHEEWG